MMNHAPKPVEQNKLLSGKNTQFFGRNQELVDIVIGLDLGTSCTKVVIQSPYRFSKWSHAIPLSQTVDNQCLLPTQLFYDAESGDTAISDFPNAKRFQNLKLRFIDNPNLIVCKLANGFEAYIRDFSIAFIANVLYKTREWFFLNASEVFRQYKIIWHLNMGIPSSDFKKEYFALYKSIALSGWHLSTIQGAVTLEKAHHCFLNQHQIDSDIHPERVNVIPEVAAEVVNYARSESRNNGLHVIIDVGASTLDIAGFELYEREGKDNYSLIETQVRRLGAYRCHLARLKEIKRRILQSYAFQQIFTDPSYRVPQKLNEYLPLANKDWFDEQHFEFRKKVMRCIGYTINALKNESDPLAKAWENGLPIFLCGGGQFVDLYQSVLEDIKVCWQKSNPNVRFKISRLDLKPMNFNGHGVDFHRLAVAYGLSFPLMEFGDIRPKPKARKIKVVSSKDNYEDNYIRKEDV